MNKRLNGLDWSTALTDQTASSASTDYSWLGLEYCILYGYNYNKVYSSYRSTFILHDSGGHKLVLVYPSCSKGKGEEVRVVDGYVAHPAFIRESGVCAEW